MEEILKILNSFDPISLEEMKDAKLMDRIDTKFSFHVKHLPDILNSLYSDYRVFEVDHVRVSHYETLYFDTKDFDLYNQHHCGKLNRFKIRYRFYKDSNLIFFEIKFKNNKRRTIKDRIKREKVDEVLNGKSREFLLKKTSIDPDSLLAQLWVNYTRITLVNRHTQERLTMDLDLKYRYDNRHASFPNLVIAELKQNKNTKSSFALLMKNMRFHPVSLSKYCFGIYNVHDNIKINNFKEKFRIIKKIAS